MSDRLKAIVGDVVDVSSIVGSVSGGGVGTSTTGRDPRDEVRSKQESGY